MIEISNSVGWTVMFDGRIIEKFDSSNMRMHINNVKKIEVTEGRKGLGIIVTGRWGGGFNMTQIDANNRSAVDEFVAQVNAAIAATGL